MLVDNLCSLLQVQGLSGFEGPLVVNGLVSLFPAKYIYQVVVPGEDTSFDQILIFTISSLLILVVIILYKTREN